MEEVIHRHPAVREREQGISIADAQIGIVRAPSDGIAHQPGRRLDPAALSESAAPVFYVEARDQSAAFSVDDGRENVCIRSGLRLDMAAIREPTVFATEWKCGDTLKPKNSQGKVVHNVQACKVPKVKRSMSMNVPHRNHEYRFFEKRDGFDCNELTTLKKRQHDMGSTEAHGAPQEISQYNIIKPNPGQPAYARVSAGMYNELFFTQADKSGLMTVGAQHGVCSIV